MSDFAGLPVARGSEAGFDEGQLEKISRTMAAAVESGHVPGVVTVLARHGKVVHAESVGSLDLQAQDGQLGMESLFRMYSQSKPVTAVVAMSLFEEGVLFLDDPISKWLPEFANPRVVGYPQAGERVKGTPIELGGTVAAHREITVFDLMTMTSGLPFVGRTPSSYYQVIDAAMGGTGFLPWDTRINDPNGTYEDMVLALAMSPLHAQPGEV